MELGRAGELISFIGRSFGMSLCLFRFCHDSVWGFGLRQCSSVVTSIFTSSRLFVQNNFDMLASIVYIVQIRLVYFHAQIAFRHLPWNWLSRKKCSGEGRTKSQKIWWVWLWILMIVWKYAITIFSFYLFLTRMGFRFCNM